jgi:hypothetical protein
MQKEILFIKLVQSNCSFLVGLELVESARILRICRMTCICTDFTRNARKVEYFGNYLNKKLKFSGNLSGALMGAFGQTTLNQKISCKCIFYYMNCVLK